MRSIFVISGDVEDEINIYVIILGRRFLCDFFKFGVQGILHRNLSLKVI